MRSASRLQTKFQIRVGQIGSAVRLPFSAIKTRLLSSRLASRSVSDVRSASDNGSYPELALQAALNPQLFSVFRRHHAYTPILEHLTRAEGQAYLQVLFEQHGLSASAILNGIEPLQRIGNPRLVALKGLPIPVSTTALRYLKVALDLRQAHGHDLGHVVEIGCGYGGQAVILDRVARVASYTFLDLWQVNLLITRFIEASSFSAPYTTSTLRQHRWTREGWDLAISNYAFSELPSGLQDRYTNQVLRHAAHGYLTMNSGIEGGFMGVSNHSQAEHLAALPNSFVSAERPLTCQRNYILSW